MIRCPLTRSERAYRTGPDQPKGDDGEKGERDRQNDLRAGENPLVHWPMRYAAAVAYVDLGQPLKARELLKSVPDWPEDSVFHHFQRELEERL